MLALVVWTQALLGALALCAEVAPPRVRSVTLRVVPVLGLASALFLFLIRGADSSWGSLRLEADSGGALAVFVGATWILVLGIGPGRDRSGIAALAGAGSAALVGFMLSDWVAPALLFYVCLSATVAVGAQRADRVVGMLSLLFADLLVVAGIAGWAWSAETWSIDLLEGHHYYLVLAGLLLRVGVFPRFGIWELSGQRSAGLLPLVLGSGFALIPWLSQGDEIWVALPVLLLAIATMVWATVVGARISTVGGWLVGAMLAIAWIAPRAWGRAAATAAVAASVVVLWRWTGGRAGPERGLLVAAIPPTIGFGAIAAGASSAFYRAVASDSIVASIPWSAFAALLPAALAGGVALGAVLGRRVEPETFEPMAVVCTWMLAAVAVALGLTVTPELGLSEAPTAGSLLFASSAVAGAVTARLVPVQATRAERALSLEDEPPLWTPSARLRLPYVSAALLAAAALLAVAFTYAGLRVGFL